MVYAAEIRLTSPEKRPEDGTFRVNGPQTSLPKRFGWQDEPIPVHLTISYDFLPAPQEIRKDLALDLLNPAVIVGARRAEQGAVSDTAGILLSSFPELAGLSDDDVERALRESRRGQDLD